MRRLAPATFLILGISGCGGAPTAPGPRFPQISGTYTGAPFWTFHWERTTGGSGIDIGCSGSLTVSQSSGTFTGTFTVGDDCRTLLPSRGVVLGGTVTRDGQISFRLNFPRNGEVLGFAFCVDGPEQWNGSVRGDAVHASTGTMASDCGLGPERVTGYLAGHR